MSLIITTNVNLKDRVEESNIHKPFSYHNRLQDTMKIPKDSEIAVQSVKINKNGLQSLNRLNSTFATYWGRPIANGGYTNDESIYDTPYHPHITSVVTNEGMLELSTNEVAYFTTRALKSSMYCPHMFTNVSSTDSVPEGDISCEVKQNANGVFQGYDFDIQFNTAHSNQLVTDNTKLQGVGFKDYNESGGEGITWDYFSGGQLDVFMSLNPDQRANVGGAQVVLKDFPVALNSFGLFNPANQVDISFANGVNGEWAVGLVRDCNAQVDAIDGQFLGYAPEETDLWWADSNHSDGAEGWGRTHQFYDYVLVRKGTKLRVYQAVVSSNRNPRNRGNKYNLVMKEIKYWMNPNSALHDVEPYDMVMNQLGIQYVGWVVDGECVEPYFSNNMGMGGKIIDLDLASTTKPLSTKPRGDLNNVLYTKIWVRRQFDSVNVTLRYIPTSLTNWTAGNPNADWVVRLNEEGTYMNWGREIENRTIMDYNPAYDGVKYPYSRCDQQSLILDNYKPTLIFAPTIEYKDNFTRMCNSQYLFGFIGRTLQDNPVMTINNNNSLSVFTSAVIPPLTSQKSLFVKLTNFTHSSANAKRGQNHSKILAHLPRFDNAGNEVGGLYFEPHERVYVALNNTNDLYINEFDVEIVYDDESYATCIAGKTIVCFHIRPRLLGEIK